MTVEQTNEQVETEVLEEDVVEVVETSTEPSYDKLKEEYAKMQERLNEIQEQAEKNERDSFNLLLQQNELSEFTSLFDETDKHKQVEILKNAVNAILIKNSYVPTDKAKQDAYDAAINKGDVQGALKTKFAKFFK